MPAAWAEELTRTDTGAFDAGSVSINQQTFPDAAFRGLISKYVDTDGNGVLSSAEISRIGKVSCANMGITSLKGIEYLTGVTELYCQQNQITSLDVSKLPYLRKLSAWSNRLTALDVSHNPNLTYLALPMNRISELDLSNNPYLQYLFVNNNQLQEIDVTGLPWLIDLNCSSNMLQTLDVSRNTELLCERFIEDWYNNSPSALSGPPFCGKVPFRRVNPGLSPCGFYFSLLLITLPLVVFGSSSRNSTMRGYL